MYVHPSSSLFNHTPPIKTVLYYELVMTSKSYMRQVMEIKPAWLMEGALFFECCLIGPSSVDSRSTPQSRHTALDILPSNIRFLFRNTCHSPVRALLLIWMD